MTGQGIHFLINPLMVRSIFMAWYPLPFIQMMSSLMSIECFGFFVKFSGPAIGLFLGDWVGVTASHQADLG